MELWDVYDINRNKTDRTWVRGKELKSGDFHLVVHVCIFNSNGEMLIQQRQSFKEGWPNLWDLTAGGSALAGDTSQTAAERELYEEIGLKVDFQQVRPHLTINFENGFDDFYLIQEEVQLHMLTLQYEEVQNVKWASKADILTMIKL
ncbi:NUDIX hydrolase [Bacillus sp. PS06]|uniref:NUDIX hydrolase n=1 Tax=Bacillus sp. PS06 TaxID=2764176 RepID=UPI00296F8EFA|nr:NUDIX domain-containing protein [Bacillus sp. PS06]